MTPAASLFLFLGWMPCALAQEQPAVEKPSAAQPAPDALATLRQTADKTAADWSALASGLAQKIATLLPCDPTARAAVEEVSRASSARLAALSAYLNAAVARARQDTEDAKRVLAAQAALGGAWNTERAEADQERTAIEAQIADLKESMRKRGSLAAAERVLVEIDKIVKDRSARADDQASRKDRLDTLLGGLVVACQDRQTALENESVLLDAETSKWSDYYTARIARAVTECSIIDPAAAKRKRRQ